MANDARTAMTTVLPGLEVIRHLTSSGPLGIAASASMPNGDRPGGQAPTRPWRPWISCIRKVRLDGLDGEKQVLCDRRAPLA
jgi:hypothetical protein